MIAASQQRAFGELSAFGATIVRHMNATIVGDLLRRLSSIAILHMHLSKERCSP